ncbi:PALP domain-containing protein [Treponema phagedenis]|uniref:pyridoxal-phosphate dependent enzyme n=1 Tax=Treponema phagedenis TaxID=162 RepID=UPI0001F63AFB|nr:pyridoxal-phosphate dependent enzyme [Treponema phagedenis]EFW38731.1 putative threonine synthase [Treponema phagedenis F0421]TYT78921.1 pyridoxal-phosphate dependent enzyme [Treponema phagedenis]
MKFYDIRDKSKEFLLKNAVLKGSAKPDSIYMPVSIPQFAKSLIYKNPAPSFRDIAFEAARVFCGEDIPQEDLMGIIIDSYPFTANISPIAPTTYVLDLFQGKTCSFKDFTYRFAARLMQYFNKNEKAPLHVLTIASGAGSAAIASAFHGISGVQLTILYPKGDIPSFEEELLVRFSGNVKVIRIDGDFAACRQLATKVLNDEAVQTKGNLMLLDSANIALLIPQSFYYIYAALAVNAHSSFYNRIENPSIIISVLMDDFGSLTGAFLAKKMGAPIAGFVAASESDNAISKWLAGGTGDLSNKTKNNFSLDSRRIEQLYSREEVRKTLAEYRFDKSCIYQAIEKCNDSTGYLIEPQGALAWFAWMDTYKSALYSQKKGMGSQFSVAEPETPFSPDWYLACANKQALGIIPSTAHPAKFGEILRKTTGKDPSIPYRLEDILKLPRKGISLSANYPEFKDWFLHSGR